MIKSKEKVVKKLKGIEDPHLTMHVPSVERVRDAHSYMSANSFTQACNAGHRAYAQSGDEFCYLCSLALLLEKAEKENERLKDLLNQHALSKVDPVNPADISKRISELQSEVLRLTYKVLGDPTKSITFP